MSLKFKILLHFCYLISITFLLSCKTLPIEKKNTIKLDLATALYQHNYFAEAFPIYQTLFLSNPKDFDLGIQSTKCALKASYFSKALPIIQKTYLLDSNHIEILYWLAKTQYLNLQLIQAKKTIEKLTNRKSVINNLKLSNLVQILKNQINSYPIVCALNPSEITSFPKEINTLREDHSLCLKNENEIFFTSNRDVIVKNEFLNDYNEYIFSSTKTNIGKWSTGQMLDKPINISGHDASVQFMADSNELIFYRADNAGSFLLTNFQNNKWQNPHSFYAINTLSQESSAFINPDRTRIYFSTNHFSKDQNLDIYYVEILGEKKYSKPINIGKHINTIGDEDSPFITHDGKLLFFSSKGHNSMGGYDIFYCNWIDFNKSWSDPVNLGIPINGLDDDLYFSYFPQYHKAYFSSLREGNIGGKDIYEITFKNSAKLNITTLFEEGIPDSIYFTLSFKSSKTRQTSFSVKSNENQIISNLSSDSAYFINYAYRGKSLLNDTIFLNTFPNVSYKYYTLPYKKWKLLDSLNKTIIKKENPIIKQASLKVKYYYIKNKFIEKDINIMYKDIKSFIDLYPNYNIFIDVKNNKDSEIYKQINNLFFKPNLLPQLNSIVHNNLNLKSIENSKVEVRYEIIK